MEALTGLGLLYELDSYAGVDEGEYGDLEVAQAASVLGVGAGSVQDDEDEEGWEAVREARSVRETVFSSWLGALTSLDRVHQTLVLFPWLVQWASERVELKTRRCEELRCQAARLVDARALVLAAAVSVMEQPAIPSGDPALALLGSGDAVESALGRLWSRWRGAVERGWEHPREYRYMCHYLADEVGRRRKGRDELLGRGGRLLEQWGAAGEVVASEARGERVLVTRVLREGWSQRRERGSFFDRLSEWEQGVLASFAVSGGWEAGQLVVRVRVPEVIAVRLLSGRRGPGLSYDEDEQAAARVVAPSSGEGLVPGILDDTPVSGRRLVTAQHLRALRSTVRDAEQLYVVAGLDKGVEVVSLSALEERCAAGWRGIILAAASDLPEELFAGREVAPADDEAPVWAPHVRDPEQEGFGSRLSMAEGERVLVRLCKGRLDVGQALRSLTLARSVVDLRELTSDSYDEQGAPRYPFVSAVWHGLLAMEQLRLGPFGAPDGDGPGAGLPLGVLAAVQVYTTDAAGLYEGRAHSPACAHRRPLYRVDDDDELVPLARMLGNKEFDPCSKCGGYAVRRLTGEQVAYYRAAHRLHALAQKIRYAAEGRGGQGGVGELVEALTEFSELDRSVLEAWFVSSAELWQWEEVVRGLQKALARAAASAR
ncbi:hypothetical protein ACIRJS_27285 [Streptomyces sp. NPDC102340]|uniref:hypothetical protein n=1 Tax=unclassified Streptomyces TaxID=2593676 RepID=UPI0037FD502E